MPSEVGGPGPVKYSATENRKKKQKTEKNQKKQNFGFCWDGEGSRTGQNLCSGFLCFLFLVFFLFSSTL